MYMLREGYDLSPCSVCLYLAVTIIFVLVVVMVMCGARELFIVIVAILLLAGTTDMHSLQPALRSNVS